MKISIISICLFLLFSCQQDDGVNCSTNEPVRNHNSVTISQGLWGDVWFWQGDFMPVCPSGIISAVERTVHIYELATNDDVEQVVGPGGFFMAINTTRIATTTASTQGFYEIELAPGTYSVFIQEGDNFYANRWA